MSRGRRRQTPVRHNYTGHDHIGHNHLGHNYFCRQCLGVVVAKLLCVKERSARIFYTLQDAPSLHKGRQRPRVVVGGTLAMSGQILL